MEETLTGEPNQQSKPELDYNLLRDPTFPHIKTEYSLFEGKNMAKGEGEVYVNGEGKARTNEEE